MVQRGGLIGPWEKYVPKQGLEIIFLAFDGMDWYKYREQITTKYLLMMDDRSVIIRAESDDKAQIFPDGFYTLEVDSLPEDWEPYRYQYGEFGYSVYLPTEEEVRVGNVNTQSRLIDKATSKLMTIHGLKLASVATDQDNAEFESLKSYIQALKAVDIMNPEWPTYGGTDEVHN